MTSPRALARSVFIAAAALAAACAPAGPRVDGDTLVLVAANTLASPRAGELLDDALSVTDVCGEVSVVTLRAPRSTPRAVAEAVATLDGTPRAVIAVLGDRTLLEAVDPLALPDVDGLVSRRVDVEAWLAGVADLRARGVLVATAPLGFPGRVEIPELVEAAEALRDAGLVDVDLAAAFVEAGDERVLTERGYDVLDTFGEQLVVRALFDAIAFDDVVPPRDDAERAARRETRALDAWLLGRDGWRALVATAVDDEAPPPSLRHAARRAALRTARNGWRGGAAYDTLTVPPDDPDAPGLALALVLAGRAPSGWTPSDPVEAGLLAALADPGTAPERLAALTAAHPHRLDAWFARQLVDLATTRPKHLRGRALRALDAHRYAAPPLDAALDLATPWPGAAADVLAALVAAQRPFARHVPSGPWLDDARRRARLGFPGVAERHLRLALERHRDLHPIATETLTALEAR